MVSDERGQQAGLGVLSALDLTPSDEQLGSVAELPDQSAAPVADRNSRTMASVLIEPCGQAATTARATICLPDV